MQANKGIITSNSISEKWWLTNPKKILKIFNKHSKPLSKELTDLHISLDDDEEEPFKTGEEMWQYAQNVELGITDENGNKL